MLDEDSGLFWGLVDNQLHSNGFDWWWHSFVGVNRYVCNEANKGYGTMRPYFSSKLGKHQVVKPDKLPLGREFA